MHARPIRQQCQPDLSRSVTDKQQYFRYDLCASGFDNLWNYVCSSSSYDNASRTTSCEGNRNWLRTTWSEKTDAPVGQQIRSRLQGERSHYHTRRGSSSFGCANDLF